MPSPSKHSFHLYKSYSQTLHGIRLPSGTHIVWWLKLNIIDAHIKLINDTILTATIESGVANTADELISLNHTAAPTCPDFVTKALLVVSLG